MKYIVYSWIEEYLFFKNTLSQKILSFILLPISWLYGTIVLLKRYFSTPSDMNIPVVSIGNLSMGGNGKTPLCICIAKSINKNVGIVLRGYKRHSDGLLQVSCKGEILCSIEQSGDEAMLIASRLDFANVIVSVDRIRAIEVLKEQEVEYILLDDGFSKSNIKKYDILIQSMEHSFLNKRVIPSGSYREFAFVQKYANKIAIEDKDFFKIVHMPDLHDVSSTTLITSISKPHRLNQYLPDGITKVYFSDHHYFSLDDIQDVITKHKTKTLLMTKKDFVKVQSLDMDKIDKVDIQIMHLEVKLQNDFLESILDYIGDYTK